MMMAQQFPGQPGMGHPGLPHGHPMAQHPGGPHMGAQNPAMGMVQGMHPGVSGPQVSQGGPMVTGMPPGAGTPGPGPVPNAHAMSHLGPAQPQMYQQGHPQMNFANPHMLQQQQQQQLAHRRMQQIAAMQAAQSQHSQPHGGIPVSMPTGQSISPAQLQALQQQARGIQNPAMMSFQMQQQLQQHPGHPAHMNPQHPQNIHPQQQHMISAQQAQPNQGIQPEQRNPNQMMRMPTTQNPTTQPPQPQPTPTPQVSQPPPQVSQPPQSQPTPPQQPPQPQTPQQPPQQPQQPQQQHQPQQQQAGQQGAQPRDQQRSQEQLKQQSAALILQQQQHQQNRARETWRGNQILRLMSFFDHLGKTPEKESKDINYWQKFVNMFFSPEGSIRQQVWISTDRGDKRFQIAFPVLPRYYLTHYVSGIKKISMHMEGYRQNELSSGGHMIHSDRCNVTYWFKDDTHLQTFGNLKATLDPNGSIEFLDIGTQKHIEYIPRVLIQSFMDSPEMKHIPEVNKKKRPPQKSLAPPAATFSLPTSSVNEYGVTPEVMQFLELAETTTVMGALFQYSNEHPHLTPYQALQKVIEQNNDMSMPPSQMANLGMQQGSHPGHLPTGQRTPGLHGPNHFASPGMTHLGLPAAGGSPHIGGPVHTPSPAQTHMAGPVAMVHQQSQQGSNMSGSQGTSANTSPNTNKRRRASAVKAEVDDTGGDINGVNVKVKASPRVPKRQKGGS